MNAFISSFGVLSCLIMGATGSAAFAAFPFGGLTMPTPSASGTPSNLVSLPCIGSDGAVKNADPADVCKAILPKCTDLHTKLVDQLKNMLEWKIYGYYYLGKDIKLDALSGMTASAAVANIEGEALPYAICSVVGHQVANAKANVTTTGKGVGDGEIQKQSIGQMKSCGEPPKFQNGDSWNLKTRLQYDGDKGKQWYAWVLGAYPWELRRNAYDVIKQLKPDLSNLNSVIHVGSMNADILNTLKMLKESNAKLTGASKASCEGTTGKDIVKDCMTAGALSVTDPVQRLCTLAKSQLALNETAIPNMLVYEVMARTKVMHALLFGNIFSASQNPRLHQLVELCSDNRSLTDRITQWLSPIGSKLQQVISANKTYSCHASCMLGGDEYYTSVHDSGDSWKNSGGAPQRKCEKVALYNLDSGHAETSLIASLFSSESYLSPNGLINGVMSYITKHTASNWLRNIITIKNPSYNAGFAGLVETIIRRDICRQANNSKNGSNVCDDVGIKNKPAGI